MNTTYNFKKYIVLMLFLFPGTGFTFAQTAKLPNPQQEKLLNGMNLLIWNVPAAEKAVVKLRIHNGAAFDQQGKEGTMALLSDILFPNQSAKDFFQEDLGGSLNITSNFDYIQIDATSDSDQLVKMLDTIANAIVRINIDKETTAKVAAARIEKTRELEKTPDYIADTAAAKLLYGDFPYGRSPAGTSESLAKIDFADLIFARQRFFTADNATLAVISNSNSDLVYRAVRRYFGAWEKADKKIPATFRQPDAPDTKDVLIENPNAGNGVRRSAMRVVARNSKDFYATKILTAIWQDQFCLDGESKSGKSSFEPHLLSGTYVISQNPVLNEPPARNPCSFMLLKDGKMAFPPISQQNFDSAKGKVIAELNTETTNISGLADLWLDTDTYKLVSVKDELQKANNVTMADVQRIAENLQKQPFVSVIVKKSSEVKQ